MSSAAAVIVGTIATDDDNDDGRLRRLDDWLGWPSVVDNIVWASIMRRLAPSFIVGLVFSLFEPYLYYVPIYLGGFVRSTYNLPLYSTTRNPISL